MEAAAVRGKYAPLYHYLGAFSGNKCWATFGEIETLLGFELPDSARVHRPWWANSASKGGHSQSLAWEMAGWKTEAVDLDNESLRFRRVQEEDR